MRLYQVNQTAYHPKQVRNSRIISTWIERLRFTVLFHKSFVLRIDVDGFGRGKRIAIDTLKTKCVTPFHVSCIANLLIYRSQQTATIASCLNLREQSRVVVRFLLESISVNVSPVSIKCYYVGKTWQAILVSYPESKSDFGLAEIAQASDMHWLLLCETVKVSSHYSAWNRKLSSQSRLYRSVWISLLDTSKCLSCKPTHQLKD